jgi:integrase
VAKQPQDVNTFKMLAEEWLAHKKDSISKVRHDDVTCKLTKYAFPCIGGKSIHDVVPLDVIGIIRNIEKLGHKTVARSVVSNVSAIFRYAKATGITDKNPADLDLSILIKPHVRTHYTTITDPAKIGELLRNIHEYTGRAVTRYCLQLMPLLMLRQGELRGIKWSEIDWESATLTIRAERMKLRRHMKDADRDQDAHIVPLSRQAVAIFRQLHEVSGMFEHCFYNQRDPRKHISGNALKRALDSMGCQDDTIIMPHGFRSMASTLLNEMGWNPDAIERQLAHVDRNAVRRSYNHGKYLDERREMLQAWADYIDSLRLGGDVVPFRRKSALQGE